MALFKDRTGMKFGRLTVIRFHSRTSYKKNMWVCKCECGNETVVLYSNLDLGRTKSCGCLQREKLLSGDNNRTHGKSKTRVHRIWSSMKTRCSNESCDFYKDYGARGITVCDEWANDFEVFYKWAVENGYEEHLTIDRKDNDKGYSPDNCRWLDNKAQSNNRRNNLLVEFDGETKTLAQLSEITGIHYNTLKSRYKKGEHGENLIRPVRRSKNAVS